MLPLASTLDPAARHRSHVLSSLFPSVPLPFRILQDTTPWWTKITLTQIVIVLSFTTIITLMISTFFFVLSTGAIRFNE